DEAVARTVAGAAAAVREEHDAARSFREREGAFENLSVRDNPDFTGGTIRFGERFLPRKAQWTLMKLRVPTGRACSTSSAASIAAGLRASRTRCRRHCARSRWRTTRSSCGWAAFRS